MSAVARSVSPCVGICKLDDAGEFCLGCARTGKEIESWSSLSDMGRQTVWDALPERFTALGIACRRLPWDTAAIRTFVEHSITGAGGTWVVGVLGAVAEFIPKPGAAAATRFAADELIAETEGAAMRLRLNDHVHALTFGHNDYPAATGRIVLAVERTHGGVPARSELTALGEDQKAISSLARREALFDLGLGRNEARFCVRTGDDATARSLRAHVGMAFAEVLTRIGPLLIETNPVRVIESALGRIEISTPIPPPGGKSPTGPHTHLLPDHLASMRALPTGLDLPDTYLPGAIFYPARGQAAPRL